MSKIRLDILITEKGLCLSRAKAKRTILEGLVTVDGKQVVNPGACIDEAASIKVTCKGSDYVSRGGFKLEKALLEFGIDLNGLICADIGASTGGFTDCMLQNGASKVYAIDAGHGQLHENLMDNPKVISMEKVNFRYFTPDMIDGKVDFAAVDVSFISLDKIMDPMAGILKEDSSAVCLIKPQFEAGREFIGKSGVVRDKRIHERIINELKSVFEKTGLTPAGLIQSPVKEKNGNDEYLIHVIKTKLLKL